MAYNNDNNLEEDDGIYFYPEDEVVTKDDFKNDLKDDLKDDLKHDSTRTHFDLNEEDEEPVPSVHEYNTTKKKQTTSSQSTKSAVISEILSYVKIILCAIAIAFVFKEFIIVNAQVPTGSMTDTINIDDRLIGFRLSYLFSDPQRGDIVIFKYPDDETQNYVKRIIGIPGDVIEISNGQVSVNGEVLEEDYILEPMIANTTDEVYVVPEDCYFMMGDNRNNSADSRYWVNKYVSRDKILAKVIFRYYDGANEKVSFGLIK